MGRCTVLSELWWLWRVDVYGEVNGPPIAPEDFIKIESPLPSLPFLPPPPSPPLCVVVCVVQ